MTSPDPQDTERYRIDPSFVVPEPTAANYHAFLTEEEYSFEAASEIFHSWKAEGVKQARLTLVSDEYPHPPYPHGYWFEGWTDENARQLPFGDAEAPDRGCSPPLTYAAKLSQGSVDD